MNYMNIRSFFAARETTNRVKGQTTEWGKIVWNYSSSKWFRIFKKLKQKIKFWIGKWAEYISKEIQMVNKYMKMVSIISHQGNEIKTMMTKYHPWLNGLLKRQVPNAGEDVERGNSSTVGGNTKTVIMRIVWKFLKKLKPII